MPYHTYSFDKGKGDPRRGYPKMKDGAQRAAHYPDGGC